MTTFNIRAKIRQWIKGRTPAISIHQQDNVHLSGDTAVLREIEKGVRIYSRPCFSDSARLVEYKKSIYLPKCDLTAALENYRPTILFDIGANIGLSSLSITEALPSIKHVVGVEAEKQNFMVLKQNFNLWSKEKSAKFVPIYGLAASSGSGYYMASRLPGGLSASGTFMFVRTSSTNDAHQESDISFGRPIAISDLIGGLGEGRDRRVILKVDIEGGEEELFRENTDWLKDIAFLTIEVHDRFGRVNSSRGLLKSLAMFDFAIYPCDDILHCYNRRILF